MSDRRGVGDPPGEPAADGVDARRIEKLIRRQAARHEPDVDRIRALMAAGGLTEHDELEPVTPRRRARAAAAHNRPDHAGRRGGRVAWPLAAAGVAVVAMAALAATQILALGIHRAAATASAPSSSPSTGPAGPSGSSTPHGSSPPASRQPDSVPSSTPSAPAGPTTPGHSARPPALSQAVSITVTPTPYSTALSLPGSGVRDWIAVGSRADGKLVRASTPVRPLGTVTVSGYGPSIVDGPYRVSWSGGAPDQQRSGDNTWQSITAVDGQLRITVPLRGDRFTVELFAGTVKTTGLVQVQAPNSPGRVSATIAPCAVDVCADRVSVSVNPAQLPGGGGSGDLVIDLGPAQPGNGLGLGLAAVVLR